MSEQQMPKPDPALKRLDILVGTWSLRGRTLDSEADNVIGMTTFDWLPGGFFLRQTFEADYWGLKIQSIEIISYDPKSDTFPSTVYTNAYGLPLPYRWDVRGRNVIYTTDLAGGAKMTAKLSEDGKTFTGGWRPNPGDGSRNNVAWDFVMTKVK